jgi:hypothetical protein
MKSKRVLALMALLLGIVGGVLLFTGFIDSLPRLLEVRARIAIESILFVGIGFITIVSSLMIWKGQYLAGGLINIVLGIITIYYGKDTEGIIILISGVLGIIAPQVKG